ncbi:hypothetical protein GCM10020295_68680 [Streptomyces cinereospinus]
MVSQEQRRRQLAREKFLRQQQRRTDARRKARTRNAVIASALGVVLIGSLALYTTGVLEDDDRTTAGTEVTESASPSKAPDPCDEPAAGKAATATWEKEPAMTIDTSAQYTMKLATTCGDIDIALKTSAAPHTVNSFGFLAGKGYFDHTKCHRLTTNGIYVLQCGDPTGSGSGGPGYTIPDENLKDTSLKDNIYPRRHRGHGEHRPAGLRRQPVLPRLPGQSAAAQLHPVRYRFRVRHDGPEEDRRRGREHRSR